MLFPGTPELKAMTDGVSQVGILMLLLLAGMETDFGIVRQKKRAAFMTSISGIVVPFGCGLILGELGKHNLLILGANVRPGSSLFFGHSILTLLKEADCSVLVVSS